MPQIPIAPLLLLLAALPASGALPADPAPRDDRDLFARAERAWQISWDRFFRPETNLFYDHISHRDPAKSQSHLPTPEEISRQFPNTCGWGTGMEDSAISAGVWMATICDRHAATADPRMKGFADRVFDGMSLLLDVSKARGFLPRSVSVADRRSHYSESSRDQYTHYCHGLWRFYHSALPDAAQRAKMRQILEDICARLESFVVPGERNYSICREDGVPGAVDKMWEVDPHEWARMPMIYRIGWDLTGNTRWRDLYRRTAWRAATESLGAPLSFRTPYAHQQAVFSMEPLVAMERDDPGLRAAWLRAMRLYADRMERFTWQCIDYAPISLAGLQMDWRMRPAPPTRSGHAVPRWPEAIYREMRAVREPSEAILSQLLVPGRALPADQLALLKHQLRVTDFDASVSYGLFYTVAAYWRAARLGLIHHPDRPGADAPIALGSRRELLVDRHLIERLDGLRLALHTPRDEGEVLRFERPWEGPFSGYTTVIRDGDLLRLYYRGKPSLKPDGIDETTCYAESRDGIRWTRPDLGLHEFAGSKANNVILAEPSVSHNFSPFLDTRPGVPPDERFKALAGTIYKNPGGGLLAFASGDGIHWRKLAPRPVITDGAFDSQNVAFWSETEGRYVAYFRTFTKGVSTATEWRPEGLRSVSRATSQDFLRWTDTRPMRFDPPQTEHIYTNQTHPYFRAPHISIGLAARFLQGRPALTPEQGAALKVDPAYLKVARDSSDAVLLTTRGGELYEREFGEAFLRPGLRPQQWVSRSNYPALNVVQTGPTQMSCYVNVDTAQPSAHLRRYSWRLDGFASAHAPRDGGELLTRPLTFTGKRFLLNFSTSAAGAIRVEIQDAKGAPIPGFTLADSAEIFGDAIERSVSWKGDPDLARLAGQPVRIRFAMTDADLFSFRFSP